MLQLLILVSGLLLFQTSCGSHVNKKFILDTNNADHNNKTHTIPTTSSVHTNLSSCVPNKNSSTPYLDRANCILDSYPLIDGHNDLSEQFRTYANNSVYGTDLYSDLRLTWDPVIAQADIPRLKAGKLGAQFWSSWVTCDSQYKDVIRMTLDQIDVIKNIVKKYPEVFKFVTTAQGILDSFNEGKIGSMIGLEGGHSIDSSLAVLRMYYELGVRYMTLTHSCNTPWADNFHVDEPGYNSTKLGGLSPFGKKVVEEMNRLGIIVDLAHVSRKVMIDAITISKAPVIFSHSSAFRLCEHHRNVPDDVLYLTKANGGVVMVNFYDKFVVCPPNNKPTAELTDVADHIEYIRDTIGVDHVGIGADFNGIPSVTHGLEDVSKYPDLFAELIRRGWNDLDLQKLAGRNVVRVFRKVEQIRDSLSTMIPIEDLIPPQQYVNTDCRTHF